MRTYQAAQGLPPRQKCQGVRRRYKEPAMLGLWSRRRGGPEASERYQYHQDKHQPTPHDDLERILTRLALVIRMMVRSLEGHLFPPVPIPRGNIARHTGLASCLWS